MNLIVSLGGFGRTTVIGALLCWKLFDMKGDEAIKYIEALKEKRLDTLRNFVPCPETQRQSKFICDIAGLSEDGSIPDRTSRAWIKKKIQTEKRKPIFVSKQSEKFYKDVNIENKKRKTMTLDYFFS